MDKILGTFYKGNSKRFGQSNWNTIKDNNDSSTTDITKTTNNNSNFNSINYNPLAKSHSIYNRNLSQPKNNHFSPNLIRMQYFDNYLEQFEFRRNLHINDYINNGIYNVYKGSKDPLYERRKDIQNKLNNMRNKLLNEEAEKFERRMKKVEQENKLLDDLILERKYDVDYNKNKDEIALHLLEDFDDKDFEKIYNEKDNKNLEELKSFKSKNDNSFLILSRTHSSASSNMDLLASSEDENDKILDVQKRNSLVNSPTKYERFGKTQSALFKTIAKRALIGLSSKNNENINDKKKENKKIFKENKHTDILKILSNLDKYSIPIDNVNKELVNQSQKAPKAFQELYGDIEQLKNDFQNKMEYINNQNKKNINVLNEVLYDLKIKKNFMELEADIYKPKIDQIIEEAIDKYTKRRIENEFSSNLENEQMNMENDFNLKMNLTKRARKANKMANNLVNEVENVNNIYIMSKKYDNDMISKFSYIGKNTKNIANIQINQVKLNTDSKNDNNIFPVLQGLNENENLADKKDINIISKSGRNKTESKKNKKTRRKKEKRNVEIKDLGKIDDDNFLYKDDKKLLKERKETIIENLDKNISDLNLEENK